MLLTEDRLYKIAIILISFINDNNIVIYEHIFQLLPVWLLIISFAVFEAAECNSNKKSK